MTQIEKIKKAHNKNINVVIGDGFTDNDKTLFDDEPIIYYPKETPIGRILIDCGICKSWSEVKGSFWKNFEIPNGFTDLFLDGVRIYKGEFWGKQPHRLTILRFE